MATEKSASATRTPSNVNIDAIYNHIKPRSFTSSSLVDDELAKLIKCIINNFITVWYFDISQDFDFLKQLNEVFAHVAQESERRLNHVDWIQLLIWDLPEIIRRHLRDYRHCREKVGTTYGGSKTVEELFHGCQPHFALTSVETETEYLRQVAESLMTLLLPNEELKSECVWYLLREVLTCTVLVQTVDRLCDPDFLNQLIIRVFSDTNGGKQPLDDGERPARSDAPGTLVHSATVTRLALGNSMSGGFVSQRDVAAGYGADPSTLFTLRSRHGGLQQPTFLKRRRKQVRTSTDGKQQLTTTIVTGISKITSGGWEKVSSGLDKIKHIVTAPKDLIELSEKRRKERKSYRRDMALGRDMDEFTPNADFRGRGTGGGGNAGSDDGSGVADGHLSDSSILSSQRDRSDSRFLNLADVGGSGDMAGAMEPDVLDSARAHDDGLSNEGAFEGEGEGEGEGDDSLTAEDGFPGAGDNLLEPFDDQILSSPDSFQDALDINFDQERETPPPDTVSGDLGHEALVSEAPFDSNPPMTVTTSNTPVSWESIQGHLTYFLSFLKSLWDESNSEPEKLGPINTADFEGENLDEPLLELLKETFRVTKRYKWVYAQIVFFLRPLLHAVFGRGINKFIIRGVYSIISEQAVAQYMRLLREALWPAGGAVEEPILSPEEKYANRVLAQERFTMFLKGALGGILDAENIEEGVADIMEALQCRSMNKHLFYVLLDVILVHFSPEVLEKQQQQQQQQESVGATKVMPKTDQPSPAFRRPPSPSQVQNLREFNGYSDGTGYLAPASETRKVRKGSMPS
ncbi:Sorting nexin-19 [Quaeritorhiza haematococci]|nr:Sorting nexin-19 [Quaeritorhiza haematococci]